MDTFVFSKKGDRGETSLLTGERVSKAGLRPEAYGTLDEASSAMGMARALTQNQSIATMITAIQEDLILLGAELACEGPAPESYQLPPESTARLERWIAELQQEVPLPREFILPGGNLVSAVLDLSRTIIRRAERRCVSLRENGQLSNPEVNAYLNRLADLLFTMARYAEKRG